MLSATHLDATSIWTNKKLPLVRGCTAPTFLSFAQNQHQIYAQHDPASHRSDALGFPIKGGENNCFLH